MTVRLAGALTLVLATMGAFSPAAAKPRLPQTPAVQGAPTPPAGQTQAPPSAPVQSRGGRGGRGRAAARAMQMPDPQTMGPGQIDQLFDALVIFQAQPTLGLTDDQWLVFGQKLKQLQNLRRRLQRQRLEALAGLREMLKAQGPLDEAVVSEKLRAFDELEQQTAPQIRQAYAAIDQVLRPRQRVQFRTFEEMMERKKLDLIAMARQRQQAAGQQPQTPIKK